MADLAIGATAVIAFWRDLTFKAAAVSAASIFLLGDAVGHVKQMVIAGDFALGNAGVPFYMDIICPVLGIALLLIAKRQSAVQKPCRPSTGGGIQMARFQGVAGGSDPFGNPQPVDGQNDTHAGYFAATGLALREPPMTWFEPIDATACNRRIGRRPLRSPNQNCFGLKNPG
jgi:hypothetical protein